MTETTTEATKNDVKQQPKRANVFQQIIVLLHCLQFVFAGPVCAGLLIYLLFTRLYPITLLYLVWYIYDIKSAVRGGRRLEWFRRGIVGKSLARYFPVQLIKTADLSPEKNYIFACHPHGILSLSQFTNFATEATNFSGLFPKLTPHLMAMNLLFWMPFQREYFLSSGACNVSRESVEYVLKKKGTGNVVAIIIGGVAEGIDAISGKMILTLKPRKGFVRIAIENGASLVPVISFGENELYHAYWKEGSSFSRLNKKIDKLIGFPFPLFLATFLLGRYGLPLSKPVTTIVGKPIDVVKNESPTREEVDQLHQKYTEAITELYEANKAKYDMSDEVIKIK